MLVAARRREAYDRYYNVVSNPTLWFIQHSSWDQAARPELGRAFHEAWHEGYERVNRAFADAVVDELEANTRRDRVLPRLPPVPGAAVRADGAARRACSAHFVHIPWPTDWSVLPDADAPRGARRPARERRGRVPHPPLARGTSCAAARTSSARHARRGTEHDVARRSHRASDLGRRGRVRAACGERRRACRGGGRSPRPERPSRAPGRPHRSVEEHRPRLPRVRAAARGAPGVHGRVACSRCSIRRARTIPEYVEYVAAIERAVAGGERPVRRPVDPIDPGRRRLPALGRGVQAVRRPARERGLRRAQPRRQGGAARQPARRRARAVGERRRVRGARGVGARRQPLRRLGAGARRSTRRWRWAGRAAPARSTGIRAQVRERTTSTPGSPAQLADLDRWARAGVDASAMAVAASGELRVVNPATLELVGSVRPTVRTAVQEVVAEARLAQERCGRAAARRAARAARPGCATLVLDPCRRARRRDRRGDGQAARRSVPTELFPALDALLWLARNAPRAARAASRALSPQLHLRHKRALARATSRSASSA